MGSDIANSVIPAHPLEDYAWKSHYTLSESAQAEIRGLLEGLHDILSEHDAKIARVRATLDQLLDERKSYMFRIDKLRSALAPHKKLPPELLSKIFIECSPSPLELPLDHSTLPFSRPGMSRSTPPYSLSPTTSSSTSSQTIEGNPRHVLRIPPHDLLNKPSAINDSPRSILPPMAVCSRWREIALNTRDLWDHVSIKYPHFHSLSDCAEKTKYMTENVQKIISRGTRSIAISTRVNRSIVLPDTIDPMRNLVIPYSHQLTHINLVCSVHHLFDFLQSSPPSFPVLESLTLKDENARGPPYEHKSVSELSVFRNTPSLKVLRMHNFFSHLITLPLSKIQLPWDQLKTIDFKNTWLKASTAHWLLSQCNSAVSCWLALQTTLEDIHIAPLTSIVQPHLQSLSIATTLDDPNITVLFLKSLTLPSLHSLKIPDFRVEDSLPGLLSLITRSQCALTNLSIPEAQIPASLLDSLFELLPALEDLDIPKATIPVPTLERMAQGVLLPKLTSIACTIQSSPRSLESFMDAVERTEAHEIGVTRLRVASTRFPPTERHYTAARWPQAIARFKKLDEKLREEGRSIVVSGYRGLS